MSERIAQCNKAVERVLHSGPMWFVSIRKPIFALGVPLRTIPAHSAKRREALAAACCAAVHAIEADSRIPQTALVRVADLN